MKKTKAITQASLIAALYVALTYLANLLGLASGAIQIRFSEALTVLPLFTAAAISGLTLGCLLANLLTGCALWDVIFGTIATLLGALGTRYLSKKNKWLAPVFPILANTLIIPFVLTYVYGLTDAMWYLFLTVAVGEVLSCGVLGIPLAGAMEKNKFFK